MHAERGDVTMEQEKLYKTMKSAGTTNLVLGIITILIGIATGVVMIVKGAKLLAHMSDLLF